jgi:hypothetical protein
MKLLKVKWTGKRTLIALAIAAGVWFLYVQGSAERAAQNDAEPTSGTTQCRVEATVDGLNVRSAPAMDPDNVVDQLAQGEQIDADKVVQNGFRKLAEGRWVSVEYVQTVEGRDCG